MEKKAKLEKKGKQFWKKKKKRKKMRESWKKNEKIYKKKTLLITVVIHSDLGVGKH
jgi:DNA-binding protein YbaB